MQQPFSKGRSSLVSTGHPKADLRVKAAIRSIASELVALLGKGRRPIVENLEARQLLSTTYFVSPSGADSNSGSLSAPFASIQRAANAAGPGDVVQIEGGTYHETVTVNHSGYAGAPIIFKAYENEKVTVTGANAVTGWSNYNGNIYSANMPWNLGEGNNEVFVNGQEINEARYPNTSLNVSTPTTLTMQSVHAGLRSAVIYDSSLTQSTNYWKGAVIHMDPGQGWVDQTGVVTSSSPGEISISYSAPSANTVKYALPKAGNKFYLVGKFNTLDSAGEWYRDPSTGRLYVWTPSSNDPNGDDVEAKVRQYAFDLSRASYVDIEGVNIFAATIRTSSESRDIIINGITAEYISQFFNLPNGWTVWPNQSGGIELFGGGDVLENSTIAYATGDGVVTGASHVTVSNNVIHDVDTIGGDMAGVRVMASGDVIEHNTIYNTGRDGIEASVQSVQILYNKVSNAGLQTTEAGGIYTVDTKGRNAVIAYNVISGVHSGGYGAAGIFLDNNSSGWTVHNNVVSNADYGLKISYSSHNNNIYNNTLTGSEGSIGASTVGSWSGTRIAKNILIGPLVLTPGAPVSGNTRSYSGNVGAGGFSAGAYGTAVITTPPVTTPPSSGGSGGSTAGTGGSSGSTSNKGSGKGTSSGGSNSVSGTSTGSVPLATSNINAMDHVASFGVGTDGWGGVGAAYNNGWAAYKLDFGAGVTKISAHIAAVQYGGQIQVRLGSPTGSLLGTIEVDNTKKWTRDTTQTASLSQVTGVQTVYLVFKGRNAIANVDSLTFS